MPKMVTNSWWEMKKETRLLGRSFLRQFILLNVYGAPVVRLLFFICSFLISGEIFFLINFQIQALPIIMFHYETTACSINFFLLFIANVPSVANKILLPSGRFL